MALGAGKSARARPGSAGEGKEPFAASFCVFLLPAGLPRANWTWPGVPFYLKSSLWPLDLPLTLLCFTFAGFFLLCLLATAILDSFSLF